jgi:hypothetical protein
MCSIILDIGAKVIREHIKHYLKGNEFGDVNQLINNKSIVSQKMSSGLNKGCYGKIPASLDSFDISKSFALIQNVIIELHKEKIFNYDDKKYDYCLQLKEIRNEKFAHLLAFQMEDVEFSVTVVTIQEIIRQLCDFDSELMQDYLDKIEVELNKDNSGINNLKNDVITLLLEQKEDLQKLITSLSEMDDVEFYVTVVTIQEIIRELCDFDNNLFQSYIDRVEEELEKYSNQLSKYKVIEVLEEQKEKFQRYISKLETSLSASTNSAQHKSGVSEIGIASNLLPCPPASKLYKRADKKEISAEIHAEVNI